VTSQTSAIYINYISKTASVLEMLCEKTETNTQLLTKILSTRLSSAWVKKPPPMQTLCFYLNY